VLERRILSTAHGPKKQNVIGDWRKLFNREKNVELGRTCSTNGRDENTRTEKYKENFVRKS
jgi:hypothetical protein